MLETTQQQFANSIKFHLNGLEQAWKNACQADDELCSNTQLSEEAWDQERDQIEFLFKTLVQYSLYVESFLTEASEKHHQTSEELAKVTQQRKRAESYLRCGFSKVTPEEKIRIRKEFEEIEKM